MQVNHCKLPLQHGNYFVMGSCCCFTSGANVIFLVIDDVICNGGPIVLCNIFCMQKAFLP